MANLSDPRVTAGMDLAAIMAEGVLLLQQHHDPRGSEVGDEVLDRFGARSLDFIQDWLLALQANVDGLGASSAQVLDTRTTGSTSTGSIAAGASGNFEVDVPSSRMTFQWIRVRRNSTESSATSTVRLYADSDRTKLIYESDLKSGDPAIDVYDFADGLTWGAFSDDGTGLEDLKLYGTIDNDGDGPSVYVFRCVAIGY
jgi:hypothetical protein